MIVEAINVNKSFDEHKVLSDVSFTLTEGMITGLVGRNGSGKTTLLKILAGIYKEDSGKIKIAGKSIEINPETIEHLAYLPDRFDYFNYHKISVLPDYYELLYPKFDRKFFEDEVLIQGFTLGQTVRNLSKGEKNLLGLITVLASNAEVILVDEILDGMDVLNKRRITEYLLDARDKGCAVFASSHELSELSGICDNILYLTKEGKLSETGEGADRNINKLQVVVRDKLPEAIADKVIILSNIGRVYVILSDMDETDLHNMLQTPEIVQFDKLAVKVEDYFYLEEGVK